MIGRRIQDAVTLPVILVAFMVGAVVGNLHGERYGLIAGREQAEDAVLQLDTWTNRALAANPINPVKCQKVANAR